MLSRYQKREQTAKQIASEVLADYGGDYNSASERVLQIVNGQRWLERMVLKQMKFLTAPKKKPQERQRSERQRFYGLAA